MINPLVIYTELLTGSFHSFLMETGGFLLTWFLLDAALSMLRKRFNPPQTDIVS